jgi:hypothetical protein
VAYTACSDGKFLCVWIQGARGFGYLFERSFDSYLFAPLIGVSILLFALWSIARVLRASFGLRHRDPIELRRMALVLSGCSCLFFAMMMAFIAGQRWSVDHYLSYQQPFLLAGLFLLARSSFFLVWFWRLTSFLMILSVLLIYLRYPGSSRSTYVKESFLVGPVPGRGDGSLCARQHAGIEWRASSLWGYCDGFGLD